MFLKLHSLPLNLVTYSARRWFVLFLISLCHCCLFIFSPVALAQASYYDPAWDYSEPVEGYNEWSESETLDTSKNDNSSLETLNFTANLQGIIERGTLRVGMPKNDNFPFYEVGDKHKSNQDNSSNQNMLGIDPDFAYGLAKELGVKVEFFRSYENHDAVIEAVSKGEIDCGIAKISRTPDRGQKVLFTQPYLLLRQALLVNQRSLVPYEAKGLSIDEIFTNDFNGDLAVLKGTSYVTYAQKIFPKANLQEYEKWDQAVEAVIQKKAFAAFRDEVEVRSIVINNPSLAFQLKSVIIADSSDSKGVAISPNNLQLREVADLYIDSYAQPVKADTILDEIESVLEDEQNQRTKQKTK